MGKIVTMVLALQVGTSVSMAGARGPEFDETGKFSGSYLCVPQASGGVRWDENRKEWHGASLKNEADGQLILKIDAVKRKQWKSFGFELSAMTYLVWVRELGEGADVPCWGAREGYHPADLLGYGDALMSPQGEFRCEAYGRLTSFKLNLGVLRYIETYLEGFIDGKDTGDDTPAVSVGKCARVD
jgi:hypothetical protein